MRPAPNGALMCISAQQLVQLPRSGGLPCREGGREGGPAIGVPWWIESASLVTM